MIEDGRYQVIDRRTALRHRLQIGTITSDASMTIKYVSGPRIGTIEEWFIAQLKPGDVFVMTAFGSGFQWGSAVMRW